MIVRTELKAFCSYFVANLIIGTSPFDPVCSQFERKHKV